MNTSNYEHPMTATPQATMDRAFDAICMLLMPFFMIGASDDPGKARGAVADLLRAYDPASPQELDLAARIIGFSAAALDNLRLSMADPAFPHTKVLRYRSTAVSLSRSSEQCRATLKKIQAERPQPARLEQQIITPAPKILPKPLPPMTAARIEQAKSDARNMLAGLASLGAAYPPGRGMTAIHLTPDPCAQVAAAVTAALRAGPNQPAPLTTR
jgi:hypothetical protein